MTEDQGLPPLILQQKIVTFPVKREGEKLQVGLRWRRDLAGAEDGAGAEVVISLGPLHGHLRGEGGLGQDGPESGQRQEQNQVQEKPDAAGKRRQVFHESASQSNGMVSR